MIRVARLPLTAALAVLVLLYTAVASNALEELGLSLIGVAYYLAESTESIFMVVCPEDMFLPDGALCVNVPGTVLEATQTINKLAAWEWRQAAWSAGPWDATRSLNADDGPLGLVIRDGKTVREWRPNVGDGYPFDGVIIGVYERSESE